MSDEMTPGQMKLRKHLEEWFKRLDTIIQTQPSCFDPVLLLGQTPLAMHILGADLERNLFINKEAFAGVVPSLLSECDSDKHVEITKEVLQALPKSLTDPVAVFETFDGSKMIYLTDIFTSSGFAVVAFVDFDGRLKDGTPITLVTDVMSSNDGTISRNEFYENILTLQYKNHEKWDAWERVWKERSC